MGREVGGGFGMGYICIPVADSRQCMVKTTTIYFFKKRKKAEC